jgi:hypothetical protein
MYRESLLILAIIFIILGVALPFIPYAPDILGTILLVVGIILFVIWVVLYAIVAVKSGA